MSSLSLRIGRFAGVGAIATVVHVSAAFLANQSGAAGPMAANSIGFACAIAVTYLGNYYWTFPGAGSHVRSLHRFAVTAGLSYLWTSSIVYIASDQLDWPFTAALAIILVTAPPATFVLSQLWVFRRDAEGIPALLLRPQPRRHVTSSLIRGIKVSMHKPEPHLHHIGAAVVILLVIAFGVIGLSLALIFSS